MDDPSAYAVARAIGVTQQTVTRCLERAAELGVIEALDDRPRAGRDPVMTAEAKTWLMALACRKAKELGYPHELWTTRLLAAHARQQAADPGSNLVPSEIPRDGEGSADVVELKIPHLEGDNLTFDVRVLEGDLGGADGPASVFVDIIGLPFTPLSFAGVARRTARRAAWSTRKEILRHLLACFSEF